MPIDPSLAGVNASTAYGDALRKQGKTGFDWRLAATALGPGLIGAAAPALFGVGGGAGLAAQTGGAGLGFGGAPVSTALGGAVKGASSGFNLGSLLGLGQLGANLFGAISGNRANSRALTAQQQEQQREFDAQQQFLQSQEATRKAEADRVAAQSQTQWEAQQKLAQAQWDADQADRVRTQRLQDEAEARKAPYRAASQAAALRLQDLLGLRG